MNLGSGHNRGGEGGGGAGGQQGKGQGQRESLPYRRKRARRRLVVRERGL